MVHGSDPATLPEESGDTANVKRAPLVPCLVLLWCSHSPERTGELCLLPAGDPGQPRVIGRGAALADDPHRRLLFARQTPAGMTTAQALSNPHVSRLQLIVNAEGTRLRVQNVGRCAASHNGTPFDTAVLEPGALLQLGKQCLFLFTLRPAWLPQLAKSSHDFGAPDAFGIVGESASVWELRREIAELGKVDHHVLILGASGTGKELVAQAIHASSSRSGRPLVARNAATLPEGIIDAELFGSAKNYPNAGMPERPGLIGQADESTLFLDEFGELPIHLQVHLLRVLDSGDYQRLGESKSRRSSFRLIAATNRNPDSLRHDVLARFKSIVRLPALSQRREDIPLIAAHLLRKAHAGAPSPALPVSFLAQLTHSDLPGNVRDLERLVLRYRPDEPFEWDEAGIEEASDARAPTLPPIAIDKEQLEAALREHNWVQEKVWKALGLSSRHALARLIKKFGVEQG
jgi:two-component system nitrogen regulation response regulator GlnG/two-component system response regulator HydG